MSEYYNPQDLTNFADMAKGAPELGKKFFDYYGAVMGPGGKLSAREKALLGLALAHAGQCPYCIESYTKACLAQGITQEEMTEAVHVAAAMKAGMALVHGMQMRRKVDELSL